MTAAETHTYQVAKTMRGCFIVRTTSRLGFRQGAQLFRAPLSRGPHMRHTPCLPRCFRFKDLMT